MLKRSLNHPKSRCSCCGKKYPLVKLRFNPDTERYIRDMAVHLGEKYVPTGEFPEFNTRELLCPWCFKKRYK